MATTACSSTSFPSWHSTTESWDEDFDFEDKDDEENSPALSSSLRHAATDGPDFQGQEKGGGRVRAQTLLVVPLELQKKEQMVRTDLSYIKDFVNHVKGWLPGLISNTLFSSLLSHLPYSLFLLFDQNITFYTTKISKP